MAIYNINAVISAMVSEVTQDDHVNRYGKHSDLKKQLWHKTIMCIDFMDEMPTIIKKNLALLEVS